MRKLKLELGDYTYSILRDMAIRSGKKIEAYATEILTEYIDLVRLESSFKRLQHEYGKLEHRYEELEKHVNELEKEKKKLEKHLRKLWNTTNIRVVPAEEGYLIIHVTDDIVYVTSVDVGSGKATCVGINPELLDSVIIEVKRVTNEVKVVDEKGGDEDEW